VKKLALALVVTSAIAGGARAAEGSIEIYTVLDDSVAHIEHSLPTSDVHTFGFNSFNIPAQDQESRWAVVSGAEQMSRYGLQGNETFDNGFSGFFRLEGAINSASGQIANNGRSVLNNANDLSTISSASSINGQAFSRAQYVGISYPLFGSMPRVFIPQLATPAPSAAASALRRMGGSTTVSGTTTRLATLASACNTRSVKPIAPRPRTSVRRWREWWLTAAAH
jgi:hypothetical protein